jgi:Flp pilus assembly protein TadD
VALALLCTLTAVAQSAEDPLSSARDLLSSGKLAEAEAVLRSYLAGAPSSADAHFMLGFVLLREQKAQESLDEFNAGARIRRPGAIELKAVASDYVFLGDLANADKWFSEVTAESPNDADAWYLLGRTKFNEDDFAGAIPSFERALALRPKYVEAENNIGLAWKETNNTEKARVAFQTAIEWQGDSPKDAQPFLNLGTLLSGKGDLEPALTYLKKASTLAPGNPSIHEELSHVYSALKNLSEAQRELEQAVALAPNISSLHFQLGQIYRKRGMKDRADQEFAICTKLSGTRSSDKTPNPISSKSTVGP